MKQENRKQVIAICLLGISAFLLLLLPQIRQMIIRLTEQFLLGRELRDHRKWHNVLLYVSTIGSILQGMFLVLFLTGFSKIAKLMKHLIKQLSGVFGRLILFITNEIQKVPYKEFVVPVLFMFGLYIIGISGIIRADLLYVDDKGRALEGYRRWDINSRYISNFLAIFLHADTRLTDISPLPQIIAALFMAAASVLLVYVISGSKITKIACFLSLPVGLSPYFLHCFSYKFDAPYMALSVLASIAPFLFMRNYVMFSVCSIISLLIMAMTYQASSGIYIIIVIILCFKTWNERRKTGKEIVRFAAVSAFSYCFSMIFFNLFLMNRRVTANLTTDIYPIHKLFTVAVNNFMGYMNNVIGDFSYVWRVSIIILCLVFISASVLFTKRNKIAALCVSLFVLAAMCSLSFGIYLVLTIPFFAPRAMYGFGIFIACITVYLSNIPRRVLLLPGIILCWSFFVFSFTYGNALSEQKRYDNFRTETLIHDLSMLFPNKTEEPLLIKLVDTAGFAPVINQNISIRYPVIHRLVRVSLIGNSLWGYYYLTRYFNFTLQRDESIEETELHSIFDSYYHTIKSDASRKKVLVILK
ncbi:MAG: glucosyltransferase domain-containing protein [Treponema sp.]|jgi:hypothetical protein|nr:glucosyltransferase domain-containing protein [Treponema sp.]